MLLITLTSVRHIHKHSKVIEHLGIKTNSTLMQMYAACWLVLLLAFISDTVLALMFLVRFHKALKNLELEQELRFQIACQALSTLLSLATAMLDWLVLYAYHRLSNKMQAKVKNLVTHTLKVVS